MQCPNQLSSSRTTQKNAYQCFHHRRLVFPMQHYQWRNHVLDLTKADSTATCYQFFIANRLLKISKFFRSSRLVFGCGNNLNGDNEKSWIIGLFWGLFSINEIRKILRHRFAQLLMWSFRRKYLCEIVTDYYIRNNTGRAVEKMSKDFFYYRCRII